jgi:hypothetical protein
MSVIRKRIEEEMSSEQWERAWRQHWQKAGFSSYELPLNGSLAHGERDFLMQPRSLNREHARLRRIMSEFEQGFRRLHKLGPASQATSSVL